MKTITIEPLVRFFPEKTSISFMKGRYLGIGVSVLPVAGLDRPVLQAGPQLRHRLQGRHPGRDRDVSAGGPCHAARLAQRLGVGEVALQQIGSDNDVLIRVQRQEGGEEAQTKAVDAIKEAVLKLDPDP
jgi:SecD/SecF fusion protein